MGEGGLDRQQGFMVHVAFSLFLFCFLCFHMQFLFYTFQIHIEFSNAQSKISSCIEGYTFILIIYLLSASFMQMLLDIYIYNSKTNTILFN
jgi:hypothetical protein